MAFYRAKNGINFPRHGPDGEEVRLEPGDVSDQLPEGSAAWLLAEGHIELADAPEPAASAPAATRRPAGSKPRSVTPATPPAEDV